MLTGYKLKEKVNLFAPKMAAVGHRYRLAILYLLAHGELPLHEIVADIDQPQNLVAHHIAILLKNGWVGKRKERRETYYFLKDHAFFELFRMLVDTPFYRNVILRRLK